MAKLEALQAAWGLVAKLPGTDFRQRCRRKRVFNVLEGSNVRFFFFAYTSVGSWIDCATLIFFRLLYFEKSTSSLLWSWARERGGGGECEQLNIGGN